MQLRGHWGFKVVGMIKGFFGVFGGGGGGVRVIVTVTPREGI